MGFLDRFRTPPAPDLGAVAFHRRKDAEFIIEMLSSKTFIATVDLYCQQVSEEQCGQFAISQVENIFQMVNYPDDETRAVIYQTATQQAKPHKAECKRVVADILAGRPVPPWAQELQQLHAQTQAQTQPAPKAAPQLTTQMRDVLAMKEKLYPNMVRQAGREHADVVLGGLTPTRLLAMPKAELDGIQQSLKYGIRMDEIHHELEAARKRGDTATIRRLLGELERLR